MAVSEEELTSPLWIYPKTKSEWIDEIINEFRIHPVTAQVLVSRGFETIDQIHSFLYSKLPDLHDPHLFPDMERAIDRIVLALEKGEGILIYGDNDVDGMTGTALLTEIFEALGARIFYYVPNRNNLRQSMIADAFSYTKQNNCTLLITVDCGITAAEGIEQFVNDEIDVIITDHHEPTDKIPHCLATLNPKLLNTNYPNPEITGVGVAFKLAHALIDRLTKNGFEKAVNISLKDSLDLVALGTISDMGALLGENRILVRYGLQQIQVSKRVGLQQLFSVCDIDITATSVADVASKIAPRMNSLGRIADPRKGVELLLIRDLSMAEDLAIELDLNNSERQKIERAVSFDIDKQLEENPQLMNDKALILWSQDWHPGVIPIVSTRLAKNYNRPTVIIAIDNKVGKGSIRSIREFPLLQVLKEHSDILLNFGGHDYAAGLTIAEENIEEFKGRFIEKANNTLQDNDILTKLFIDAKIDLDEINFDFMESLKLLEPHGNENPPPILYCDVKQTWPPKVIGNNHLKLYVEQKDRMLEGIAFGMAHRKKQIRKKNITLRIAFTPHINTFQNKHSIQLLIRDFLVL